MYCIWWQKDMCDHCVERSYWDYNQEPRSVMTMIWKRGSSWDICIYMYFHMWLYVYIYMCVSYMFTFKDTWLHIKKPFMGIIYWAWIYPSGIIPMSPDIRGWWPFTVHLFPRLGFAHITCHVGVLLQVIADVKVKWVRFNWKSPLIPSGDDNSLLLKMAICFRWLTYQKL